MNLNRKTSPQNIANWLETATRDLVPSAQARVRAEIEAHVTQAVQTHLKNGHSESEAMAAALADLGDAKTAGARFRREHLTTVESGVLAIMAWVQISLGMFFVSALFTYPFLPSPDNQPGLLGLLSILFFLNIAYPTAAASVLALVWRSRNRMSKRLISMLLFVNSLNVGAYATIHFEHLSYSRSPHSWMSVIIIMEEAAFTGYTLLRIRKKLAAKGEDNFPQRTPVVKT